MKKIIVYTAKYLVIPVLILLLVSIISILSYRGYRQHTIKQKRAITSPNGIDVLETVSIGGIEQWIQIRGKNKHNPILLFLHGGPGMANMGVSHLFQDEWEDHFNVVQWDQRGAGKSNYGSSIQSTLTIDQMISDTIEMAHYLCERFNQKKIFILGHSWGSFLGIQAIKKHPELFHAYIGVGQIVNKWESERISYEYTLKIAKERGNTEAVNALRALAPYPSMGMGKKISIQRKWLMKFGGTLLTQKEMILVKAVFESPYYTLMDFLNFPKGIELSINMIEDEFVKTDLTALGYEFEVPIFFFNGRHDYCVSSMLADDYFKKIRAPHKEQIWFEKSAHIPMIEEPEKFTENLISRVRPLVGTLE